METEIPTEVEESKRKITFSLDVNLGHLFVIFSLFLSAAGLYAHDETRLSIVEEQVSTLNDQNLNPRVTATEVKIVALREGMDDIHNVLIEIRNELAANHQDTVIAVKRVNQQTMQLQHKEDTVDQKVNQTQKAVKNRFFP